MTIALPWPNPGLSPNARLHWAPLRKLKAAAREEAAWDTKSQMPLKVRQALAQGQEPIPLTVTFVPPDRRPRDHDNMIASAKAALDGIADALAVNDNRFRPAFVFAEPQKPGRVEVAFA